MIKNIVVVCTGNICRSPIAEGLIKARSAGRPLEVASMGTQALVGSPADANAIAVMHAHGYDIGAHRAQQATAGGLKWADLILALDRTHIEWIVTRMPALRGRVFSLGRWYDNRDIADPYRQPEQAFVKAYEAISAGVDEWLKRIA